MKKKKKLKILDHSSDTHIENLSPVIPLEREHFEHTPPPDARELFSKYLEQISFIPSAEDFQ